MQPHAQTACTVAQFCAKYKVHRSTFYRNLKRGLMPPVIKIGWSTRILREDEEAWLSRERQPNPPEEVRSRALQ